jgi:Bardet-Biedl syndrome 1 protein
MGDEPDPWLHAWHDPLAGLRTAASCVRLCDLFCDGDVKLIIGDFSKKLRIYKGQALMLDYDILDSPVAVCDTYLDEKEPRIPALTVASGPNIFVYRQMRPYRKWTCPAREFGSTEKELWTSLSENCNENDVEKEPMMDILDVMRSLRDRYFFITVQQS